jgi:hypothetical protein
MYSHLYSPSRIVLLIKDWNFIIHLCVYGSPSSLLRLVVKAHSETNCWTHLPHLEGWMNECGALFSKTSLFNKTPYLTFNIYSSPIVVIYNHLDVNIYQQHISAIYHQQVITTRNTKNTRCMYNFSFYYGQQSRGFSTTTE